MASESSFVFGGGSEPRDLVVSDRDGMSGERWRVDDGRRERVEPARWVRDRVAA